MVTRWYALGVGLWLLGSAACSASTSAIEGANETEVGGDDAAGPVDDAGAEASDAGDGGSTGGPNTLVLISAGSFTMGSPPGEWGRRPQETQHKVTLTHSFYLQATEVTQWQWRALMKNDLSDFPDCGANCPVGNVNWWDALEYANALSRAEGLPECYTLEGCVGSPGVKPELTCTGVHVNATGGNPYECRGYRLPTEAEWEFAYRAGTTTALYNGDTSGTGCEVDPNLDAIAWYCGNAGLTTHPVGSKLPNAFGLFDMSGNVSEWCWDGFLDYDYRGDDQTDPTGFDAGIYRVTRGGRESDTVTNARAAARGASPPSSRLGDVGFRLARTQ